MRRRLFGRLALLVILLVAVSEYVVPEVLWFDALSDPINILGKSEAEIIAAYGAPNSDIGDHGAVIFGGSIIYHKPWGKSCYISFMGDRAISVMVTSDN
jgi:hypothetical protein